MFLPRYLVVCVCMCEFCVYVFPCVCTCVYITVKEPAILPASPTKQCQWSIIPCLHMYEMCLHQCLHYTDVIMNPIASQITSLTIVCSTVYSDADQRKHQSSASLAFVWNSPHKWPVTRKTFPFDDVIMVVSNKPCGSIRHEIAWYNLVSTLFTIPRYCTKHDTVCSSHFEVTFLQITHESHP